MRRKLVGGLMSVAMLIGVAALVSARSDGAASAVGSRPSAEDVPLADGLAVGDEVAAWRTDRSTTTVTEGGFQTVLSGSPVRFRDEQGEWRSIDTTMVESESGWRNSSNRFEAELPMELSSPVELTSGDVSVSMELLGVETGVEGQRDGSAVTYDEVMPGVDVIYTSMADGLKEEIVLASSAAARRFVFEVQTDGGELAPTESGGLELVDAEGAVVWSLPPSFVVDAAGASAPVEMILDGSTLTLSASDVWLDDPARSWPVVIDPSYITGVADCGIESAVATPQCSNTTLEVGSANSGADKSRALIAFGGLEWEVSPWATVMNAELQVTVADAGNAQPMAVDVHPLTNWWTEDATWEDNSSWSGWSTVGGDYDPVAAGSVANAASTGVHSFDVTGLVADWVRRDRDPVGFLVKAVVEDGTNTVSIHSAEASSSEDQPQLVVDWAEPSGQNELTTEIYGRAIDSHTRLSVVSPGYVQVTSTDYTAAGTGLDLNVGRSFNSGRQWAFSTVGYGWQSTGALGPVMRDFGHGRQVLATGAQGDWVFQDPEGDGTYVSPPEANAVLVKTGSSPGTWTLTFDGSGIEWTLVDDGGGAVVTQIVDPSDNTVTVNYQGSGTMHDGTRALDSITDTQNRVLDLPNTACCSGWLDGLSDWNTPADTVDYQYDGDSLVAVEDLNGDTTGYEYDWAGNLTRITDPLGNDVKISYGSAYGGRVESITVVDDPVNDTGPTWTFSENSWTTHEGQIVVPVTVTDPNNVTTTFLTETSRLVHATVTTEISAPTASQVLSGTWASLVASVDGAAADEIEFWVDGSQVGTDNAAPYNFSWDTTTVADGAHTVIAKAIKNGALLSESEPVAFTVDNSTGPEVCPI